MGAQIAIPYSFKETLPPVKVPISAEQIRLAKEQIARRDAHGAVKTLRVIREKLEKFERRISHKPDNTCH